MITTPLVICFVFFAAAMTCSYLDNKLGFHINITLSVGTIIIAAIIHVGGLTN